MQQEQFFKQLIEEDDISWKALILEAVKNNQMNPWDIEISFIASEFLKMLKQYKQMNFKLSGKVILASALLLKLKSHRFISEDINLLDQLIASTETTDDILENEQLSFDEDGNPQLTNYVDYRPELLPRTPQPRKRKVSVYDLIEALEQAIEVNKRREARVLDSVTTQVQVPRKQYDITKGIDTVYQSISRHYLHEKSAEKLTFTALIPSEERNDKMYTFIPLLHLRNMERVDLVQPDHFADFTIELMTNEYKKKLAE